MHVTTDAETLEARVLLQVLGFGFGRQRLPPCNCLRAWPLCVQRPRMQQRALELWSGR